jgi:predicted MFS family arabinose efflux permease
LSSPLTAESGRGPALRSIVIGVTAFLTVVDLFATQAILPSLAEHYGVAPAAMSVAVNASTGGMAAAGLAAGFVGRALERRTGILFSLVLLAVPTALLAVAPDLQVFTLLRTLQGICMASAFTLTLAYLGEECSVLERGGAFAAYITGNVASNLFGRLISAAVVDHFGIAWNFIFFAALNLAGAALVYGTVSRARGAMSVAGADNRPALADLRSHLRHSELRAAFAIGFCILFAFIGTFTFVNFVLVRPPIALGRMQLGLVYFVFLPSIGTTLLAGAAARRIGSRAAIRAGLALGGLGLPFLLSSRLAAVVFGMALVGIGTFFAQAVTTGFVAQAARGDRAVASGIYLSCYFSGGLAGTAVLGALFDLFGWGACVTGIGAVLLAAMLISASLWDNEGGSPL